MRWKQAWEAAEPVRQLNMNAKYAEARVEIQRLTEAHADNWRLHIVLTWLLGLNHLFSTDYEGALEAAERLERLVEDHDLRRGLRGGPRELRIRTYLAMGRFDEVRREAASCLEEPSDVATFNMGAVYTARAYAAEGNYEAAEGFLRKQAERVGDVKAKGMLLTHVAEAKFRSGDKEGALEVLDQVIRDYPQVKDRAQTMRQAMSGATAGCGCGCGAPEAEPKVCAEECCAEEDQPAAKQEEQDKP